MLLSSSGSVTDSSNSQPVNIPNPFPDFKAVIPFGSTAFFSPVQSANTANPSDETVSGTIISSSDVQP